MKILLRSNSLPVLQSMHNTFVQDQIKKEGKKNTAMSVLRFCLYRWTMLHKTLKMVPKEGFSHHNMLQSKRFVSTVCFNSAII